ncbi:hypothetical protein P7K49_015173, partial [Saguinus oedipus]
VAAGLRLSGGPVGFWSPAAARREPSQPRRKRPRPEGGPGRHHRLRPRQRPSAGKAERGRVESSTAEQGRVPGERSRVVAGRVLAQP